MHLILIGATGLIGSATLDAMLRDSSVSHVSIFARSAVEQATDSTAALQKCTVYQHKDFSVAPEPKTLTELGPARGCVWALGVSTNSVNPSTYEDITVQWPLTWARAFAGANMSQPGSNSDVFNFVYVSGEGATQEPGIFTPRYDRVKGKAEVELFALRSPRFRIYSARAGAVDRSGHEAIVQYTARRESLQKKLENPIRAVLRVAYKNMISPSKALGEALVKLAGGDGEPFAGSADISDKGWIIDNIALRQLVGP